MVNDVQPSPEQQKQTRAQSVSPCGAWTRLREALVMTLAELRYYQDNGPNIGQHWAKEKLWFKDGYIERARTEVERAGL